MDTGDLFCLPGKPAHGRTRAVPRAFRHAIYKASNVGADLVIFARLPCTNVIPYTEDRRGEKMYTRNFENIFCASKRKAIRIIQLLKAQLILYIYFLPGPAGAPLQMANAHMEIIEKSGVLERTLRA